MCLAIPSKLVEIHDISAVVDVCGARREVSLLLLPDEVAPGDYVLVHAGFAMQKVDQDIAEQSLRFFGALVDAGRDGELPAEIDDEMREILKRGTIAWGRETADKP
jgi:hydrogenase expression/formation protein HypC